MRADDDLLQEHVPGKAGAWDDVWRKQRRDNAYVRLGRTMYNALFLRAVRTFLGPDVRFLELGCGTASLGTRVMNSAKRYTGLDASAAAIAEARGRATEGMTFIEADIYDADDTLPLGQADVVWSQGLVEHFRDPAHVIRRHLQFCAPGGTVMFSVPSHMSYFHLWYLFTRLPGMKRFWPWTAQRFYTKKELLSFVRSITDMPIDTYDARTLQPFFAGISIVTVRLSDGTIKV